MRLVVSLDAFLTKYDLLQLNHWLFQCFQDREALVHHEIHQGVEHKTRTFGEKTLCGEIILSPKTNNLCLGWPRAFIGAI